jgi:CDP-glycerol glycerophosphotransferase (TagB/SpsB family)
MASCFSRHNLWLFSWRRRREFVTALFRPLAGGVRRASPDSGVFPVSSKHLAAVSEVAGGQCNPMDADTLTRVVALEQKLSTLTGELAQARNDVRAMKMAFDIADLSRRKNKKRVVLFFGRDQFVDNSKYLFAHAALTQRHFVPVWCSFNSALVAELKSHGFVAFDMGKDHSRTISLFLSAAVAVHCVNPHEALRALVLEAALAGAVRLQLWHGVGHVGTKKIDLMLSEQMNLLNPLSVDQLHGASSIDVMVSPSRRFDAFWRASFGVRDIIRAGLPRNEVLLREPTAIDGIGAVEFQPAWRRHPGVRLLWAPTFTGAHDLPVWAKPEIVSALLSGAAERNPLLFVKPHPFDQAKIDRGVQPAPGVILLPADRDIYPVLDRFDLLITDKSSLLSDFLLLDRPVLMLNATADADPKLWMVYGDAPSPGIEATYAEAAAALRTALCEDRHAAARAANRQVIFETDPAAACADITRAIAGILGERCPDADAA